MSAYCLLYFYCLFPAFPVQCTTPTVPPPMPSSLVAQVEIQSWLRLETTGTALWQSYFMESFALVLPPRKTTSFSFYAAVAPVDNNSSFVALKINYTSAF